jgi:hypothetical protein
VVKKKGEWSGEERGVMEKRKRKSEVKKKVLLL